MYYETCLGTGLQDFCLIQHTKTGKNNAKTPQNIPNGYENKQMTKPI
jgi:hypothetical protein